MTIELGLARNVDAESFGQPGGRTFRVRIIGGTEDSASLWMEKEQLQALSLAFTQMLAQLGKEMEGAAEVNFDFPEVADHDFKVGRMGIGFDPGEGAIVLQMFDISAGEDDDATLTVRLTPEHCSSLNSQLRGIIASGRPMCPLCSFPIEPAGHVCIRTNGHLKQPIPEARDEDDEDED